MDIRLLGPVELHREDRPVVVGAPMLRTLLAVFAVRPGQLRSAASLCDQLWGTTPPSSRATLRTYVMRLRRLLPDGRLRRVPSGGYVLDAAPEETDLGRFRTRLALARGLAETRPDEALRAYEAACLLWRGEPLAGLGDGPFAAAEAPRLAALRLDAQEERFAVHLRLGRHAEILDELAAEARAHHLREGLTRHLMLALHRSGRTSEALDAYRSLRRRLVEDLGIEPGHELRAVEQAILRADPALLLPGPGAPPNLAAGPRSKAAAPALPGAIAPAFPAAVGTFVARAGELALLGEWLDPAATAPGVCLLDGPGGVGKSALAVLAARKSAARFPDGLLHVDLRGADPDDAPLDVAVAAQLLLSQLGVPMREVPQEAEEAAARFRVRLRGRRCLVLLDNARDAAQVRPLLPDDAPAVVLVTSRMALTGLAGGRHLHLGLLDRADSVRLLRTIAGPRTVCATPAQWAELAGLCGDLPLALRIVAARMAARPGWEVAEWIALLRDERGRMDQLRTADLDLRAGLMVGIDRLAGSEDPADRQAAALFPLLGVPALHTYRPASAAALAGCTPAEAEDSLERLTDARIADSPRSGVYVLHDLLRAAARWQADRLPPEHARERLGALARWYLGTLHRAGTRLSSAGWLRSRVRQGIARFPDGDDFPDSESALAWADTAVPQALTLAEQCAAPEYRDGTELAGRPLSTFGLSAARALTGYFALRMNLRDQRRLATLVLRTAERDGDAFARGFALGQLGKVLGQSGDVEGGLPLLSESWDVLTRMGEVREAIASASNLVGCLGQARRPEEAIRAGRRALAAAESADLVEARITIGTNMGHAHYLAGDLVSARRVLIEVCSAAPEPTAVLSSTLASLAACELAAGDHAEAARWARTGLALVERHPVDPLSRAELHSLLASALRVSGDERAARAESAVALRLVDELNARENLHLRIPDPGPA
ncbi:AfsR/SARP family transcriptional regulator [Streptomyces marincola]|uniref:AfsR/SARP family transcriptional regulator n=1 Tax=Streptomyces marincola TaxID=2878388 RepID=UPI001CF0D975|nr:AfsR/SARP family transcriptional regulator [Streptomyces marincola]UCM88143.1 winged helix-turn-helix domain-containing protein [Streptomyces marincola]